MKNIIKKYKFYILGIIAILFLTIIGVCIAISNTQKMDYNSFLTKLENQEIEKAEYSIDSDIFYIWLKNGDKYEVNNPQNETFKETLLLNNVNVSEDIQMDWEIVLYVFGFIAMMVFFYFVFGRFYLQNSKIGSSLKNKLFSVEDLPNVTFNDVAGNEEAKENLIDIVQFLHDPLRFKKFGAKCPKGVLLTGAPGIGKTLLAKAMAGEAKVPFISVAGSEFTEMYVGVGASRVRELFKIAREKAPCILFIDEIDAIGSKRSDGSSNDEKDNTLNQLLVELDGFNGSENIVVIAATNRPDILDTAFRSGRFDRQIQLLPPDRKAREAIIQVHLKDKPLSNGISIERLGRLTIGMTGADISNAVNEAAIIAAKKSTKEILPGISARPNGIEMEDLEQGIAKVLVGDDRKSNLLDTQKEREITAWHEAGHTLVALLLNKAVTKATIVPTTKGNGGHTLVSSDEQGFHTRKEIEENIMVAYAGRIAEELRALDKDVHCDIEKEITNGSFNDIEKATQQIRYMVTHYGMNKSFANISTKDLLENGIIKSSTLEEEIKNISQDLYKKTQNMLKANISLLKTLTSSLLAKETLYEDEINSIINEE